MTKLLNKIARAELIDMVPYQSARRLFSSADSQVGQEKIWLNANEASGQGQYKISADNINRYPDFQPENLLNAYSEYCGLAKANLLATRGADEGIELIIRSFCRAYQDNILICSPTYGMYAISAENHGTGIINVPLNSNCELDLDGLKAQVGNAKVVFLCSPGNPTGNLLPKEQIRQVIELYKDSAMVVIDEAYIEFSPEHSCIDFISDPVLDQMSDPMTAPIKEFDNVIILRTLSKAFALAGLRCGFTIAKPEIITLLSKVIAPYPISAPVAEIASQALSNNLEIMTHRVAQTNNIKLSLSNWLEDQTWCNQVFKSNANFVLFRCISMEEKNRIFDLLVSHNILIRDQSKQLQLEHCLRISIGSEQEINLLKQALTSEALS